MAHYRLIKKGDVYFTQRFFWANPKIDFGFWYRVTPRQKLKTFAVADYEALIKSKVEKKRREFEIIRSTFLR